MSDESVGTALRSAARLVVIEAPAGCGKTFQGAQYAREIAKQTGSGCVLILAHTHAACDVFAARTRGVDARVDIRTIDSLISEIAGAYHLALGLPENTGAWAQGRKDGYSILAAKVAGILLKSPMISRSLAQRYPVVICDEHQDANADQHSIGLALHEGGAMLRIFGDPMQRIFGSKKKAEIDADDVRWEKLKQKADEFEELDKPHRWEDGSNLLGQWILAARTSLRAGGKVDLRGALPQGVSVIVAENKSPAAAGGYQLAPNDRKPIDAVVNESKSILLLTSHNKTVDALCSFFNRRLPIWEGHVRNNLAELVSTMQEQKGNAANIARALVVFAKNVTTGFSMSAYGNIFLDEVSCGCVAKRSGKPATLQALGRLILEQPDHKGVAKVLRRLGELAATDPAFKIVKVDYYREYWEAVRLGQFEDPDEGFAEISHRRTYARPAPPAKAISTVHKAKGLECDDVMIIPCDAQHFSDGPAARCRLYVAMSRAIRSLTFVASRLNPSPLILV